MKIKWMIGVVGLVAIAGVAWQTLSKNETVSMPVTTLKSRRVAYTATYTGKIESAQSKSVYTDAACIAGDVLVKTGQTVEKGDVLFTVDTEATRQVAAMLGDYGDYSEVAMPTSTELVAPVRGVVTAVNVKEGEIADTAKPCVVISSGEDLQVKISVPEKGLPGLFVGQKVSVSGVAFARDTYHGRIDSISSAARTQLSGTVTETVVDAVVLLDREEIDDSLRVGLSAKAEILLEEVADALVVPYEAVMQDDTGAEYVYVLQNGQAVRRSVTTGRVLPEGFVVSEGLTAGERIILSPERVTENGMAVTAS